MATSNPYDPNAAVAKSGTPRRAVLAERFTRFVVSGYERIKQMRLNATTKAAQDLITYEEFAWGTRMRALFGRGYKRKFERTYRGGGWWGAHEGEREVARRHRQIVNGTLQTTAQMLERRRAKGM